MSKDKYTYFDPLHIPGSEQWNRNRPERDIHDGPFWKPVTPGVGPTGSEMVAWERRRAKIFADEFGREGQTTKEDFPVYGDRADLTSGRTIFRWYNFLCRDLEGVDFRGLDLRFASLSHSNLSEADLTGTKLSGAEITYSNLKGVNLSHVNLSGEDIEIEHPQGGKVLVRPASLVGSHLEYANLEGANLCGVDLSNAKLSNAQLKDAEIGRKPGAKKWQKTNLDGTDIKRSQFMSMRLRPGIDFGNNYKMSVIYDWFRGMASEYIDSKQFDRLLDLADLILERNPNEENLEMAKGWKEKATAGRKQPTFLGLPVSRLLVLSEPLVLNGPLKKEK